MNSVAIDVNGGLSRAKASNSNGMADTEEKKSQADYNAKYSAVLLTVGQERSKAAFAELFHEFAPRVRSYLRSLGAVPEKVEEVAQEVMISVWRKAEQYDPEKSAPVTWIFTIARNRYIDLVVRKKEAKFDEDDIPFLITEIEGPEVTQSRKERENIVQTALSALPSDQADLIKMAYYKELSHREISEKSGVPLGTIKSRLRSALTRLRKLIGDKR